MKAIIKTGGKQYIVSEGDEIFIEKLDKESKDKVVFDEVLMIDGEFGKPFINGAKVEGEVIKNGKDKKIIIYKYTQKTKSSRTKQGHRQPYTKVKITKISK